MGFLRQGVSPFFQGFGLLLHLPHTGGLMVATLEEVEGFLSLLAHHAAL